MGKKSKKITENGIRDIDNLDKIGQIQMNLKQILDSRNISVSMVHKRTKTDYKVIKRYYLGESQSVDLHVLTRICFALECDISDILYYQKPDI